MRPPRPFGHAPGARSPPHGGPGGPGGGVKPPTLWAYDRDARPSLDDAPPLPLRPAPTDGVVVVSHAWWTGEVSVVAATGWGDGCAFLRLDGNTVPGFIGALLPRPQVWGVPVLAVLATAVFGMGPVVGRIRRLTAAVRTSAASGYNTPVPTDGPADELTELAVAFDEAGRAVRQQLDETTARELALRTFVANTTHDVAIPLTVLQGHLATLRRQVDEGGVTVDAVTAAMDEAQYVGAMLANLGVAARLDGTAPVVTARVDLAALVGRVVSRHATIARERGVALASGVPDEPVALSTDEVLVERALGNLVFNAIRHNRAGGHVAVVLDLDDDRFSVRVVDDGPGLSDADLTRLGERGFRTDDARQRSPDGQGIGLDIAFRVAERLGLTLTFRRPDGGGLEAELRGPRALA